MKFAKYLFYYVGLCSFCINNGISAFSGEDPEIAKLREEIDELKAEIETLKAENQDLEHSRASIDENSKRIKKLEEESGSQAGQSPDNGSTAQIEELNKKVEELKDKEEKLRLETAQADARLEKIESQNHPVAASAIALAGKGLDFLSSQFNANEIIRQISSGKSVAATASNLTEEERSELRAIESDIKAKGLNPETQMRLNTFNEKVVTREIETNKFQQVTFYGINEGFKDNVTIAYILYQARFGNRVSTEDILTGKINTVDQELIDTIYDMAQSDAKMPDILKNIKLIFNGAPMKVIKKSTIAPAILQQPISTPASQTCSVQLSDFTAQTSQNSSTNDATAPGQTQFSNQGNAGQPTIPSINVTNARESQIVPSTGFQGGSPGQQNATGNGMPMVSSGTPRAQSQGIIGVQEADVQPPVTNAQGIRSSVQMQTGSQDGRLGQQNVTGNGMPVLNSDMPLTQNQRIVGSQEVGVHTPVTNAQGIMTSVQVQTESQGSRQGHQNATGNGVQNSANMPVVNSNTLAQSQGIVRSQEVGVYTPASVQVQTESQGGRQGQQNATGNGVQNSANMLVVNSSAPLVQSQGIIGMQEAGVQPLAIQNDRIATLQPKVVNPASQPMQKIVVSGNGATQQANIGTVPVLPNAQNSSQVAGSDQSPIGPIWQRAIASASGGQVNNAVQQQLPGQSTLPPQPQVVDRTQSQQPASPISKGSLTVMDVESNTYYEVPTDKFSMIAKQSSGFPPKTSVNGRELSPLDIKSADALKRLHTS